MKKVKGNIEKVFETIFKRVKCAIDQEKMIQRIAETDKQLVEEIEAPQDKEEKKAATGGKTVDREFGFMTQETFENYFFIFNVVNYNENGVRIALCEEEILFSYEDQEREFRSWIKLLKSYTKKESQINFVKDYLVVNLKKTESEFWESNGWKKQGKGLFKGKNINAFVIEYNEDFLKRLQEYEEQEKLEKEAREKESAEKDEKAQEGINHDEVQEKEEEEVVENKRPEPKKIEERYVEKRSINFINFRRNNLAFEID